MHVDSGISKQNGPTLSSSWEGKTQTGSDLGNGVDVAGGHIERVLQLRSRQP